MHNRKHYILLVIIGMMSPLLSIAWGFYGHKLINRHATYLLPPEMLVFYKPNRDWLSEHSVDPDKRRYLLEEEGPRHYIDLDRYYLKAQQTLPTDWFIAVMEYGEDTLRARGIGPWWTMKIFFELAEAFRLQQASRILRLSADLGHYVSDLHVPLHTHSNHNGQHTGQEGIHGFWESRIPELFTEKEFDLWLEPAEYLSLPANFLWDRLRESHLASDSVLKVESRVSANFPADAKYAFVVRNGQVQRNYSESYARSYHVQLNGMVEKRLRLAVRSVACFWLTAWVIAGQPDLSKLSSTAWSEAEKTEWEMWQQQRFSHPDPRKCEN